jgi:hypothetical protein
MGLMFLAGIILCGCGESAQQKEILDLQTRIDVLEGKLQGDEMANSNFQATAATEFETVNENDTNLTALAEGTLELTGAVTNINGRLTALESWQSDCEVIAAAHGQARPSQGANSTSSNDYGIPDDVLAGIKAEAEQEWPSDYDMQNYVIQKQVAAYKQLHGEQ